MPGYHYASFHADFQPLLIDIDCCFFERIAATLRRQYFAVIRLFHIRRYRLSATPMPTLISADMLFVIRLARRAVYTPFSTLLIREDI